MQLNPNKAIQKRNKLIIWHRFCSLKSTRYYHSKHSVVIGLLNQGICLIESQLNTFFGHHKIKDNFPNISIRGLFQSEQLERYIISHLVLILGQNSLESDPSPLFENILIHHWPSKLAV